ncbi:hypothetical protein CCR75_006749 [Bremia lactucae]|uniref:Uncharacterized protein n=1 Tax=Bremia lactucae TaxID=4779 RepID=A0A976FKR5_BRELC|nr:hypothetical protein CCR75_006749 [Bremia lactucae]
MASVRRILPDSKGVRVLPPGVYLVCGSKRNMRAHCFAMEVTPEEDVLVLEDGVNSGIGHQIWARTIMFICTLKVHICGSSNRKVSMFWT